MEARVLSLDVSSSSTGWAFVSSKKKSKIKYGLIKTSSKHSRPRRLLEYKKELKELLRRFKPTHIVIEDIYSGPNIKTLILLAKFAGITEECGLSTCAVEPYIIHNNTVKSYFKVKNKEEMFEFMVDIFEWKDANFNKHNDITDSLGQLLCYCDHVLNVSKYRFKKDYGYLYEV